jgi:hypothetical protein
VLGGIKVRIGFAVGTLLTGRFEPKLDKLRTDILGSDPLEPCPLPRPCKASPAKKPHFALRFPSSTRGTLACPTIAVIASSRTNITYRKVGSNSV